MDNTIIEPTLEATEAERLRAALVLAEEIGADLLILNGEGKGGTVAYTTKALTPVAVKKDAPE